MRLFQENPLEKKRGLFFLTSLSAVLWLVITIIEIRSPVYSKTLEDKQPVASSFIDEPIPITLRKKPKTRKVNTQLEPVANDEPIVEEKIELVFEKTPTSIDGLVGEEPEEISMPSMEEVEPMEIFALQNIAVPFECGKLRTREEQLECLNSWIIKFISKNTKYPPIAKQFGIEEKIIASFVIGTDGSVRDVEIVRGNDQDLIKATMEVFEKMPDFIPASQNGRKAAMRMVTPVNFKLR